MLTVLHLNSVHVHVSTDISVFMCSSRFLRCDAVVNTDVFVSTPVIVIRTTDLTTRLGRHEEPAVTIRDPTEKTIDGFSVVRR